MRNRISRHFQNAPLSNFVASKFVALKLQNALLPNHATSKITRKLTLIYVNTVIVAGSGDMRRSAPEDGCNNYSGLRGGPRLATSPKGIAMVIAHRKHTA